MISCECNRSVSPYIRSLWEPWLSKGLTPSSISWHLRGECFHLCPRCIHLDKRVLLLHEGHSGVNILGLRDPLTSILILMCYSQCVCSQLPNDLCIYILCLLERYCVQPLVLHLTHIWRGSQPRYGPDLSLTKPLTSEGGRSAHWQSACVLKPCTPCRHSTTFTISCSSSRVASLSSGFGGVLQNMATHDCFRNCRFATIRLFRDSAVMNPCSKRLRDSLSTLKTMNSRNCTPANQT